MSSPPHASKPTATSPSWDVAVARWFPMDTSHMGVHQLMDALQKKHTGLLRQALLDHPGVCRANFHRLDSKVNTLDRGHLAHVVVNLGWTDALDVLWEAGDRLDKKSSSGGHTAPELAVFSQKPAPLRRMLKLGVNPDKQADRPLAQVLLRRTWQKEGDGKVASILINAGASPWTQVNCKTNGKMPLVMALLANNANEAAEQFVSAIEQIPPDIEPSSLLVCWLTGFEKFLRSGAVGDLRIYERMLSNIQYKGCPPCSLEGAVKAGVEISQHSLASNAVHAAFMESMIDRGPYTQQDFLAAHEIASKITTKESSAWKASLAAKALESAAPPVMRASQSMRL